MERHVNLSRISRAGTACVVGAVALTLTACGSDDPAAVGANDGSAPSPAAAISGTFAGAGSSAQKAAIDAWTAAFQSQNPDATVNYDPSGSGAGREQFLAGGVQWAGSDSALTGEEIEAAKAVCGTGGAWDIPVYISPIALAFNVPGVEELNLSAENVAKIFAGTITTWNDPVLVADNPQAALPDLAITPVHRSDKSGTTNNFTDWLNQTAPEAWPHEKNDVWPLEGGDSAEKTSGVIGVVTDTPGAITYADESGVGTELGVAAITVGENFNKPSAEGAANVVSSSPLIEGRPAHDLAVEIDRTAAAEGDYPLLLVSYTIVCSHYQDQAEGNFVKALVGLQVSEAGQQVAASAAGSAPLAGEIATRAIAAVEAITVG